MFYRKRIHYFFSVVHSVFSVKLCVNNIYFTENHRGCTKLHRVKVYCFFLLKIVVSLIFIFLINITSAQQPQTKPDSSKIYRDIETFSKKSRITKFIYGLLLRKVDNPVKKISEKEKEIKPRDPYKRFDGKIIRTINITTLDPFGYSASDTTVETKNFLYRTGNKMHIKSLHLTIQNLLLIHKNQTFDPLLMKESERLIRSQKYVQDVFIYIMPAGKKSDSIDIFIRELDVWSITPEASLSTSNVNIDLTDKNFLGFGHEFQNIFKRNFNDGISAFSTTYSIPNIRNTYISSSIHYQVDGYLNNSKSITVDRPFYSSLAKWAAGAYLYSQLTNNSLTDTNFVHIPLNIKLYNQDYWIGKSQQIFKGNSENARSTNLITALRYQRGRYFEKPSGIYDSLNVYSNEDFFLAGIGLSTRKYIKDN